MLMLVLILFLSILSMRLCGPHFANRCNIQLQLLLPTRPRDFLPHPARQRHYHTGGISQSISVMSGSKEKCHTRNRARDLSLLLCAQIEKKKHHTTFTLCKRKMERKHRSVTPSPKKIKNKIATKYHNTEIQSV
jgi:hypothetical protein